MLTSVVIFVLIAACHSAKLPNYFSKCSKSDPNLEQCLTKSANAAWPSMVKGDNSAHIQKLNPFTVPIISINIENVLRGNLTDSVITGMEQTTFQSVKLDFDKKTVEVKFIIPMLKFDGGYEISGKLLFFNLEGKGPSNITFADQNCDLRMEYSLKDKGGNKYIEIEKTTMSFTTSRVSLYLSNLFGGDKQLGETINTVLNENWEALVKEIGGNVGDAIGAAFSAMLQLFFRRVPFEELFSD